VPVVGRSDVREGVRGPLLIEEFDTTTVVPPGWTATLDEQHTTVLEHDA
jgi:N-methylhydantoinase A